MEVCATEDTREEVFELEYRANDHLFGVKEMLEGSIQAILHIDMNTITSMYL